MTTPPKITFLLPVHNSAATLPATLDAILAQTLPDFELVIIDDASTDATGEILRFRRDPRIRLFKNETRLEVAATLNRGLSLAQSDYIARIDADDLCLPHRAATQAAFLDAHPAIAVAGSFIETFHDDPSILPATIQYPTDPPAVAAALIFRCPLAHPAVMLRKSALDAHALRYDESFPRAQDYDLWSRCVHRRLALANIPEVLLRYRVHPGQATIQDSSAALAAAAKIRLHLLQHLGLRPTPEQQQLHEQLSLDHLASTPAFIAAAAQWLITLAAANDRACLFDREAFLKTLTGRFVALSRFAHGHALIPPQPAATPFARFILPEALRDIR